jgi:metal-responsive CopG/Arc/MetJ family transcriptional regulator
MRRSRIAVSLDPSMLKRLDRLVKEAAFPSRSRAIRQAIDEKLARLKRSRLARECAKLDPQFEKALADDKVTAYEIIGS